MVKGQYFINLRANVSFFFLCVCVCEREREKERERERDRKRENTEHKTMRHTAKWMNIGKKCRGGVCIILQIFWKFETTKIKT